MQNDLILLVMALLAVLSALASTWMSRAALRRCQILLARHPAPPLASEQEERSEHMSAMDARLAELERQLRQIGEQQKRPDARETHPHYEPAIRLARKGADVDDLVATCGLARGEAELIALLHRKNTPAVGLRSRV